MAHAYVPGLEVSTRTKVVKLRELPLPGRTLVKPGDRVQADTAVLSAERPGELDILRLADKLTIDPLDVARLLKVRPGDTIKKGDVLCERAAFFGLFRSRAVSPVSGTVEFFTEANAHLGIRRAPSALTVKAYISGTVIAVEEGKSVTIETEAALAQGIFGVGGERQGVVHPLNIRNDERVTEKTLAKEDCAGKVLVGGSLFTLEALHEAARQGAAAVITGSIESEVLTPFVGHEIALSVTGDEAVPLTLIITEGFGELPISERIMIVARESAGRQASVNGATQVRAGAMRPELIIPSAFDTPAEQYATGTALEPGARIRCIRVPYFGAFATVTALPHEPQRVASGAVVRILKAKLDSGEEVIIPRANVELV